MYNTNNVVERITLEEILNRTTEYDIYRLYIGKSFKIGHIMNSPLRNDKNPSFGIFKCNKSGDLLFKDHSTGEAGNCIKFVQLKFDISYNESLKKIWNDITGNKLYISKKGEHQQKRIGIQYFF